MPACLPAAPRISLRQRHARVLAGAACLLAVAAAPDQPPIHFDIDEYRVVGNTVLPATDIEQTVEPFLGPNRTAADVEQARAALEALYVKRGYPTVSAEFPRQRADSGVILLQITERKVGRLRVTGSRYFALDAIKAGAPSVAEGRVPNINDVQKEIVGLNQWPDRTVTPELKPGRAANTIDVDLVVKDTPPLHGSIELNNRRQADTRPLRASASLSYDNLWQRGDSASVSFQLAPEQPEQSEILAGSYLFRVPDSDVSLLFAYTHTDSNVRAVSTTAALGRGDTVGMRVQVPLWFEPGFTQNLAVGADYKHYKQTLNAGGAGSTVPLEYVPGSLTYSADWFDDDGTTSLTASFIFGVRGLGNGNRLGPYGVTPKDPPEAIFDANRTGATPSFSYLRGQLTHTHTLPYGMEAYANAVGQVTNDPLVPQEQFSLGGLDSVRGYLETEALVDYGGALQTELRSPSYAQLLGGGPLAEARVHVFADGGGGGLRGPTSVGQTAHYSFGSVGVGARVRLYDSLHAEVQDAHVLSAGPSTASGTDRVLFRLYGDF